MIFSIKIYSRFLVFIDLTMGWIFNANCEEANKEGVNYIMYHGFIANFIGNQKALVTERVQLRSTSKKLKRL